MELLGLLVILPVALVVARILAREKQRGAVQHREDMRIWQLGEWARFSGWTLTRWPAVDWGFRLPGQNRDGVSLCLFGVVRGNRVSVAEYSYVTTKTETTYETKVTYHTHTTYDRDGAAYTTRKREANKVPVTKKVKVTHHLVVVVVHRPVAGPWIQVLSRSGPSRIVRTLFGEGSSATGHPEFDSRFRVIASSPEVARQLIGPALAAEHVAGRVPLWSLSGTDLITHYPGPLGDPSQIPPMVEPLLRVAGLLGH